MPDISSALAGRLALCYLLGSIPFAIFAMRGTGIDILRVGSGNPGFNNVLRYSKPRAGFTLAGDLGKGLLAIWLCHQAGEPLALDWLYGLAAILGHCYSPFLKFNGGKGIATSTGVMLYLYPSLALACGALFLALRLTGARYNWREAGTIASLSSFALFVVLLAAVRSGHEATFGAVLLLFTAWRHKKNFLILFSGAPAR